MATAGEEAAVIAQEFVTSLSFAQSYFCVLITFSGLDNVPAEVQFLLAEMRERENKIIGMTIISVII